jgi:hypothetical protein
MLGDLMHLLELEVPAIACIGVQTDFFESCMVSESSSSLGNEHIDAIEKAFHPRHPTLRVDRMHLEGDMTGPGTPGKDDWRALEAMVEDLDGEHIRRITLLFEERAWNAGALCLTRLAEMVWSKLSRTARGHFLGGIASFRNRQAPLLPTEWFITRLEDCDLDMNAAIEIGTHAAIVGRVELLRALLKRDLPSEPVVRQRSALREDEFEVQFLRKHSTSFVDVILEAAVRANTVETARLALEYGANPNIPCWVLDRNWSEWFGTLSFAINDDATLRKKLEGNPMLEILLQAGVNVRGLPGEDRGKPLFLAVLRKNWILARRLLANGAKFERDNDRTPYSSQNENPPHFGVLDKEYEWVKFKLAPLLKAAEFPEVYHYIRYGLGGQECSFLMLLAYRDDVENLRWLREAGMPVDFSVPDLVAIVSSGAPNILRELLQNRQELPHALSCIRQHRPNFPT